MAASDGWRGRAKDALGKWISFLKPLGRIFWFPGADAIKGYFGTPCRASTIGGAAAGLLAGAGVGSGIGTVLDKHEKAQIIVAVLGALIGAVGGAATGAALVCWKPEPPNDSPNESNTN